MRKLIIGNWKMHGELKGIEKLLVTVRQALFSLDVDVVVCPTFVHLSFVHGKLKHSKLMQLGAQDVSAHDEGAYTGEVAAPMLKELGCHYVIIGHSECRQYHHDTDEIIAAKMKRALAAQLTPILCIGETKAERDANKTEKVLETQLTQALQNLPVDGLSLVVAYEPVWAIGTGLTASNEQIGTAHKFIRNTLRKLLPKIADTLPILYGGSVKPKNAQEILAIPEVAGALVGGASIIAEDFISICEAAEQVA